MHYPTRFNVFKHALYIAAALSCANPLFAPFCQSQEIVDDFNDDSPNDLLWLDDPGPGQSTFIERNGRLEFIHPASNGESYTNLKLNRYPAYNESWSVECVGWMDASVFTSVGQSSLIGISIGNSSQIAAGGDEFLDLTVGAGVFEPGEPPIQGVVSTSQHGDFEEQQILEILTISRPAGLRVSYDPDLKAFQLDFNLEEGFPDSTWRSHRVYTVDGSSIAGEDVEILDWQMTEQDLFVINLTGSVSSIALNSGTAWLDDFGFTVDAAQPDSPPVLSIGLLPSGNEAEIVELRVDDADHDGITIESSEDLDFWAIVGEIPSQENAIRIDRTGGLRFFRARHD